ncbi:MAG: YceI family protein [Pseudomonadota bacterium]
MKYFFLLSIFALSSTQVSAAATDQVCTIDRDDSLLQIRVYKDGPLSALGDNHLITTREIDGRFTLPDRSGNDGIIELSIPTRSLVVNDPTLRASAEEGFNSSVSEFNRRITRKSMLGPKVLDAENFPLITLAFLRFPSGNNRLAEVEVGLHGQSNVEAIPVTMIRTQDRLTATGQFFLSQNRYGIKPFSIMFGGIRVKDKLRVDFRVSTICTFSSNMSSRSGLDDDFSKQAE